MKKLSLVFLTLFLAGALPTAAFAEYDKSAVVGAMRFNLSTVGNLKKAIDANDYFTAAGLFMDLAKNMQPLLKFTPPKGQKAEWDKTMDSFVTTALKGVGACGEKDSVKMKKALDDLWALNKTGHAMFK